MNSSVVSYDENVYERPVGAVTVPSTGLFVLSSTFKTGQAVLRSVVKSGKKNFAVTDEDTYCSWGLLMFGTGGVYEGKYWIFGVHATEIVTVTVVIEFVVPSIVRSNERSPLNVFRSNRLQA